MDFILEDLDWRKILIRRYKNYHLDENDLAVILLINELNRGVPHLVNPEEIEPYTTLSLDKIDEIMSKLIKAGYASIEGASFSVNALKKKIYSDTIKEVSLADDSNDEKNRDVSPYYQLLQTVIKRQLTSLEYDTVASWIAQNTEITTLNDIISAISKKRKNISIALIDKEVKTRKKNLLDLAENRDVAKILETKLYNLPKNED